MIKKISVLVFVVTFLLGLLSIHSFISYFASESLKRDVSQMLYLFHDAVLDAETSLSDFAKMNYAGCTADLAEKLNDSVFKHPAVRWIGIETEQGENCYSNPKHIDTQKYNEHPINETFSLAATTDDYGSTDLIIIKKSPDLRYIAALNPFMFEFMAAYACVDCIEYELIIDSTPELIFGQDTFDGPAAVTYEETLHEGQLKANLKMEGNSEFMAYYRDVSLLIATLISFLAAILLTMLCYRLLLQRQSLERVIKDAIKAEEFKPYYQAIVDSRNKEVVGAEVLVRWVKADGTVIPPYQFIPFAEDSGLIMDITNQLVDQVGRDMATFKWKGTSCFASINIVPEHLHDDELLKRICAIAEEHGLDKHNFAIEITERKKIENLKNTSAAIAAYHAHNIDTKLDDAGTGYGGFSYVQELGIKTIKIDKMFVDTILHVEDIKHSVLNAIVVFAKSSGMKMIAEGVEDQAQVTYLQQLGVNLIQGYVYSKPMNAEDFKLWLKK